MLPTVEDLKQMREQDIRMLKWEDLVDVTEIKIDENLPRPERIAEFIRQAGNPYCFRVGEVMVKVGFSDEGKPFEEIVGQMLGKLDQ